MVFVFFSKKFTGSAWTRHVQCKSAHPTPISECIQRFIAAARPPPVLCCLHAGMTHLSFPIPDTIGAVLDDSNLDIEIDVRGYHNLPSKFHDSRICLGLASHGERVLESCFEQVNNNSTQ